MKHLIAAACLAVAGAGAAMADPVHGTWRTAADDNGNYGHIQVTNCGSKICGTLIKSFDASGAVLDTPNTGRQIIWDMEAKGGGDYRGGKVYAPDRDRTYNSRMQLNGNTLSVSGCVLGVCRDGGSWTRVN
ncbi:MAG: DUF2147 domain-containing protein [Pseudomonadota bacterium]